MMCCDLNIRQLSLLILCISALILKVSIFSRNSETRTEKNCSLNVWFSFFKTLSLFLLSACTHFVALQYLKISCRKSCSIETFLQSQGQFYGTREFNQHFFFRTKNLRNIRAFPPPFWLQYFINASLKISQLHNFCHRTD